MTEEEKNGEQPQQSQQSDPERELEAARLAWIQASARRRLGERVTPAEIEARDKWVAANEGVQREKPGGTAVTETATTPTVPVETPTAENPTPQPQQPKRRGGRRPGAGRKPKQP